MTPSGENFPSAAVTRMVNQSNQQTERVLFTMDGSLWSAVMELN